MTKQDVLDQEFLNAAFRGDFESLKEALQRGANINATDSAGRTALFLLVASDQSYECVKYLLSNGIDVDVRNDFGVTVLMDITYYGQKRYAKLLLDHGVDTSLKDSDGNTAYDTAIEEGYLEIAEMLDRYEAKERKKESTAEQLSTSFEKIRARQKKNTKKVPRLKRRSKSKRR